VQKRSFEEIPTSGFRSIQGGEHTLKASNGGDVAIENGNGTMTNPLTSRTVADN